MAMSGDRTLRLSPQEQQLKAATKALIHAAGGQVACAELLGCRQQRMSEVGLPNTPDFIRIDEVAAIEDITHGTVGHPHVTHLLARRQGFTLLRQPSAPPEGADLLKLVAETAKENGEVASAILTSLADGDISRIEQAHILEQIDEQIDAAMRLRGTVAMLNGGR